LLPTKVITAFLASQQHIAIASLLYHLFRLCQVVKIPKLKIENNIRRTKPGNDQKRGNQTIAIKAAWHKQKTDIERLNGGVLKRRPMNLYGIARTNNRVVHFLTSLLKLVENRTRYTLPHMRYSLCFIRF